MAMSRPVKKIPLHIQSAQNRVLVKNATVVNDDRKFKTDIYIENNKIVNMGRSIVHPGGCREIDATDCYVMPGGVDLATNFDSLLENSKEVSCTDFYNGSKAALVGGTTTVVNTTVCTASDTCETLLKKFVCDVFFSIDLTADDCSAVAIINRLVESEDNGIKMYYLSIDMDFVILVECLELIKKCGAVAIFKPFSQKMCDYNAKKIKNNHQSQSYGPELLTYSFSEDQQLGAYEKIYNLLDTIGCKAVFLGVTSSKILQVAKTKNSQHYMSISAPSLYKSDFNLKNECWNYAANHMCKPPLSNKFSMLDELKRVNCKKLLSIDSNHVGVSKNQRLNNGNEYEKISCGINFVQQRMSMIWTETVDKCILDPCEFVAMTSTNAAKLLGCYPEKGRLEIGSDADIVIIDRTSKPYARELYDGCDSSIYNNDDSTFCIKWVIKSGEVVVDCETVSLSSNGEYYQMVGHTPVLYDDLENKEKVQLDEYFPVIRNESGKKVYTNGNALKNTEENVDDSKKSDKSEPPKNVTRAVRNQQTSSIVFGDDPHDVEYRLKPSTKVVNPPGGKSSHNW